VDHEQSLADIFRDFMRVQSIDEGYRFHTFSLDGQDRDAGADYLFTDSDRFSIIEFKYNTNKLISEKKKTRRLTLCKKLPARPDMMAYHDKCHFITYYNINLETIQTNIYRKEVCNKAIFGKGSGLTEDVSDFSGSLNAADFASNFFSAQGSHSLSLKEFETYLAWLLTETSGSSKSTLELIAFKPNSKQLSIKRLNSISEAQEWVKDHIESPPPKPKRNIRP